VLLAPAHAFQLYALVPIIDAVNAVLKYRLADVSVFVAGARTTLHTHQPDGT
jgi:hypothetical protein